MSRASARRLHSVNLRENPRFHSALVLANDSMGAGARWTRALERTLESAESEFRPVGKMGLDREPMLMVSSVLVRERERGRAQGICDCIVYMLPAI
jgi:hypothetical protein